jgi:hypothetical protein
LGVFLKSTWFAYISPLATSVSDPLPRNWLTHRPGSLLVTYFKAALQLSVFVALVPYT